MKDVDGNEIEHGSLISWNVYDSDDFNYWQFYGIVHDTTQLREPFKGNVQKVVYLGGGCDFGMGIGNNLTFDEVIKEAENNDDYLQGITVIGKASNIPNLIKGFLK